MLPYVYMRVMNTLPREIHTLIQDHRDEIMRDRIAELEINAAFAMNARYDRGLYTKYMTAVCTPDCIRDSFLLSCMRRSLGSIHDWAPGVDYHMLIDDDEVSAASYYDFYINWLIKY